MLRAKQNPPVGDNDLLKPGAFVDLPVNYPSFHLRYYRMQQYYVCTYSGRVDDSGLKPGFAVTHMLSVAMRVGLTRP